jgi:predicted TIM-barrel fold metal-dependent hydrolase
MEMIEPLAQRVQALGWHVQIHLRADQIVAAEDLLLRLPGTIVFDHLGRMTPPEGLNHPAYRIIRRMLDGGRTWMKLSGAYFFGGPPRYAGAGEVARAYIAAAPERVVWGSDWPHVAYEEDVPEEGALLNALADWVPDEQTRKRILVDNPSALYFKD